MEKKEKFERWVKEEEIIKKHIKGIKHRIVVFSGKGGVGKTTVSVNLSYGLVARGFATGILDADITGPNVPKMVGVSKSPKVDENKMMMPVKKDGLYVISIGMLITDDTPIIWRGPMRSKAISQFLRDVNWGELDFLIADLPPGTGDEVLTIAQRMEPDLAIVVTTPQEVSILDCRRAIKLAKKMKTRYIGVIENMSGLRCPKCGTKIEIFGSGGGVRLAREMCVEFLGKIPIEVATRESSDEGKPIVLSNMDSYVSKAIFSIIDKIIVMLQ